MCVCVCVLEIVEIVDRVVSTVDRDIKKEKKKEEIFSKQKANE